jgi:hypothetical protein
MNRIDMEYPQWGKNYLLPFPDDYMRRPDDDKARRGAGGCRRHGEGGSETV